MGHYSPVGEAHAIEQAIVGVRLFESADAASFDAAIKATEKLQVDFPGRMQIDAMALAFGRQVITHGYVNQAQLYPGFICQRVRPDGSTQHELTIERSAVTYRTNEYQRWEDVARVIESILCPVVEALTGGDMTKLAVVELRCVDRFNVVGDGATALKNLVRPDTKFIPPSLLDSEELLHAHCGWFQGHTDDGRYLLNINLDLGELDDGERTATILQVISAQCAPERTFFSSKGTLTESMLAIFLDLHAKDKAMLAGVITDELQAKIGLSGSSGISVL